ncbi:MAG: gfo/Idh/MocA family oxidoreductase, partial [Prolixibacteraceae bacterium]
MTQRRDFIKKSILGTAGITLGGMGFSAKSYASIMGANDRFRVAVCGINGRGKGHISSLDNIE